MPSFYLFSCIFFGTGEPARVSWDYSDFVSPFFFIQIWLLEPLRLIVVPYNMETYVMAHFCQQERLFEDQTIVDWVSFLEKFPPICLTVH